MTPAEGWRSVSWGDLATLEYGKSLRGYQESDGPYRVYGTNGPIGWHSEALCPFPSVVIGRKGAYRGVHYSAEPFYVIDTAFFLKPKVELDTKWAYYQLLTQNINGMDSGSAIPSTSREDFYSLPVSLPPLDEQRAIAHVLGTLDDKIDLNRRMNETLEATAHALFRSWFVDFEPVRAKVEGRWRPGESLPGLPAHLYPLFPDRLVPSELGDIPEGWEVRGLAGIADFTNGLALQRFPPEGEEWLPVIKIAEMRRGYTEKTGKASTNLDPRYIVEDGDVLFSWSGSLELVLWSHGRGALNQHLFKVTSDEFPRWFYWGWLHQHLDDFRAIAAGKATTMGHIQRHHLTDAKVVVPQEELLEAADGQLGSLLEQQVALAVQSRDFAILRDTLLPRLVSGELRLREARVLPAVEAGC